MPGRIKRLDKYTSYFKLNKLYAFIGKSNLLCKFRGAAAAPRNFRRKFQCPTRSPFGVRRYPRCPPRGTERPQARAIEMSGALETGMLRIPVLIQNL